MHNRNYNSRYELEMITREAYYLRNNLYELMQRISFDLADYAYYRFLENIDDYYADEWKSNYSRAGAMIRYRPDHGRDSRAGAMIRYRPDHGRDSRAGAMIRYRPDHGRDSRAGAMIRYRPDHGRDSRAGAMIRYRPDHGRDSRAGAMIRYRPDHGRDSRAGAMIRYRPDHGRDSRNVENQEQFYNSEEQLKNTLELTIFNMKQILGEEKTNELLNNLNKASEQSAE
jgi:hypothetical protein